MFGKLFHRSLSHYVPKVELTLTNEQASKLQISAYESKVRPESFKTILSACIAEIDKHSIGFMNVDENYIPETRGDVSVYISIEYTPR